RRVSKLAGRLSCTSGCISISSEKTYLTAPCSPSAPPSPSKCSSNPKAPYRSRAEPWSAREFRSKVFKSIQTKKTGVVRRGGMRKLRHCRTARNGATAIPRDGFDPGQQLRNRANGFLVARGREVRQDTREIEASRHRIRILRLSRLGRCAG